MANDVPISGVPRYEYLTWATMILAAPGPTDREQLVLIMREARANLSDIEYAQLQRDLRYFGLGDRMGNEWIVNANSVVRE